MGIFGRAARGENLSPLERAALRFLAVVVWGALLAGLQAALPLLSKPDVGAVPWAAVGHTFLAAFLLALTLGVSKFHTAQGDPPLPVAGAIRGLGLSSVVARQPLPALVAPPSSSVAPVVTNPPSDLPDAARSAIAGIPADLVAAAAPPAPGVANPPGVGG